MKGAKMEKQNKEQFDKDINRDPNQDLSLLDEEVKRVDHDIKDDDYILEVKNLKSANKSCWC